MQVKDVRFRASGVADHISAALLFACLIIIFWVFRDYGLGWDDYSQKQYGDKLIAYYESGFRDRSAFSFANIYLYGGAFDMAGVLLERILPFEPFEVRRLLGALIGVSALTLSWLTARRLGGSVAGLLTLILILASPRLIGDAFINSKDIPFAAAVIGIVFASVCAFQSWPRPSWGSVAGLGIALGFGLGTRVGIVVSGAYLAPALLAMMLHDTRHNGLRTALKAAGSFSVRLLPALLIAYLMMIVLWPWSSLDWLNPLHAFITFIDGSIDRPWGEIFAGREYLWNHMPDWYVPQFLLISMSEIFLLCGISGIGLALWQLFDSQGDIRSRAALSVVITAALLPLLLAVVLNPPRYGGIRHYLFMLLPMAVLGGLFFDWAFQKILALRKPAITWASAATATALVLLPLSDIVHLHPYQYAYFNHMIGGLAGAQGQYMADYWGLSFKEAGEALSAYVEEEGNEPPAGGWRVAACGPHNAARVSLGPDFSLTWEPKGAHFALVLGEYYCANLPMKPIAEVERDGVVLARAYDVRGKSFSGVFRSRSSAVGAETTGALVP